MKIFPTFSDTSQTTGTGPMTCDGGIPIAGRAGGTSLGSFARDGDQTELCIIDGTGNYEIACCTISISNGSVSFSRDTVVASSNAGSQVNWGVGQKFISNQIPAYLASFLVNFQQNQNLQDVRDLLLLWVGSEMDANVVTL